MIKNEDGEGLFNTKLEDYKKGVVFAWVMELKSKCGEKQRCFQDRN